MLHWSEVELHRWVVALNYAGEASESVEESTFYTYWEFDITNSPAAVCNCGC